MINANLNRNDCKKAGLPYPTADLLLHLDGTILDVEGTKYFIDKKSGKNFLITGYDFATDWTKGFPYKSAATISAPVGDATLIAADINNFLYDSGWNPNQIPVVSLFQDIDYEHRLFCKHESQILDVNGVEIYEPRVSRIVFYSTVQADANLAKCNSYFGVPEENLSAKWVDASVAMSGDGSKLSPWKTITEANTSVTEGEVYVKTGVYVENGVLANLYLDKANSFKSLGLCEVQQTSQTYTIATAGNGVLLFEGFKINATGLATGIRLTSTSQNKTFSRCYLYGATQNILQEQNVATNCKYEDCVIKSTGTHIANLRSGAIFNNCYFDTNISSTGVYASSASYSGDNLQFNYCKFTGTATYHVYMAQIGQFNVQIFNNKSVDLYGDLFWFQTQRNFENKYNLLNVETGTAIRYTPDGAAQRTSNSLNNFVNTKALTGYGIGIGNEGTSASDDSATTAIKNNVVLGPIYNNPSIDISTVSIHGIFCGHLNGTILKYNYANGCGIGIIKKHTLTAETEGIAYNLTKNNVQNIYVKGAESAPIYNNVVINELEGAIFGIRLSENGVGGGAINTIIKNNIVYSSVEATANALIYFDDNSSSGLISDYNIINGVNKYVHYAGATYNELTDWQVEGFDANSIDSNPLLDLDLIPQAGSPAIGAGLTLDAAYDDGLDASTDWGSETEVPVVVTKQQIAPWDIGAYIS